MILTDVFFFLYTGDLNALKKKNFTMKEGVDYRVKIHFKVKINPFYEQKSLIKLGYEMFLEPISAH